MRAYMSEPCGYAGARITVPIKAQRESARYALKEARRILAETEPESSLAYAEDASPVMRARGAWRGIPRNLTAHEALAVALSAFVGEGN